MLLSRRHERYERSTVLFFHVLIAHRTSQTHSLLIANWINLFNARQSTFHYPRFIILSPQFYFHYLYIYLLFSVEIFSTGIGAGFRPVEPPTSLFFSPHLAAQFSPPLFGNKIVSSASSSLTSTTPSLWTTSDQHRPGSLQEMLSWSPTGWPGSICGCCKPGVAGTGTDLHRSNSLAELRRKAQEHSTASALLGGLAGFPGGLPLHLPLPLLPPLLGLSRRPEHHHHHHLPGVVHQIQPATKEDP